MTDDEAQVDQWADRYSAADITAEEFEIFVAEILAAGEPGLEDFTVTLHETIEAADGSYDFDGTVRFHYLGMNFLVVVEAKRHTNAIKRELVQVLYAKAQSVSAQKAILISTAPFQRGAIQFAKTHGVALVKVTEGRFTFETRAATESEPLSRQEAMELYGIPPFVGVYIGRGAKLDSTMIAVVDAGDAKRVQELLLGVAITDE